MIRGSVLTAALAATIAFSLPAQEYKVGSKVGDFNVQNLKGESVPFSKLRGQTTVMTFVSVECPVSNDYNERMTALFKDYGAKGVHFVFVNSNSNENASAVEAHAKQAGFPFPVYKDANNVVADKFGATVTPESYVFNAEGKLVYHGSIDDQRNANNVTEKRLRKALDETMAGKPVSVAETKAFGCTIKKVRKASDD